MSCIPKYPKSEGLQQRPQTPQLLLLASLEFSQHLLQIRPWAYVCVNPLSQNFKNLKNYSKHIFENQMELSGFLIEMRSAY